MPLTLIDTKNGEQMHLIKLFSICFLLFTASTLANEQELRILCWEGYAPESYTQQFEQLIKEKYDVKLTVIVDNVSDPQEFFDRIRAKRADVISPSHHIPKSRKWRLIQSNLVLPINIHNLPNFDTVITDLQQLTDVFQDGYHYGIPLLYGPYGLGYNEDKVKTPPSSWNQLWDSQHVKK